MSRDEKMKFFLPRSSKSPPGVREQDFVTEPDNLVQQPRRESRGKVLMSFLRAGN